MLKLEVIQNKIHTWNSIRSQLAIWRFKNQKLVFTNGCFDILHRGHIHYLSRAADLGDVLIIGVNNDMSVKRIKGNGRPINDEISRLMMLSSLHFVDAVIPFDQNTPFELINLIRPDVLVKGGDYLPHEIVGYDLVKATGGEVVIIGYLEGFSTSAMIDKLQKK